mmetsp:Transcript_5187/g.11418  ORF Transcript_5187/g.11418 Transcript_5187/m.11418 type:complete len:216 (-) Transcript_5187:346-993(-)
MSPRALSAQGTHSADDGREEGERDGAPRALGMIIDRPATAAGDTTALEHDDLVAPLAPSAPRVYALSRNTMPAPGGAISPALHAFMVERSGNQPVPSVAPSGLPLNFPRRGPPGSVSGSSRLSNPFSRDGDTARSWRSAAGLVEELEAMRKPPPGWDSGTSEAYAMLLPGGGSARKRAPMTGERGAERRDALLQMTGGGARPRATTASHTLRPRP